MPDDAAAHPARPRPSRRLLRKLLLIALCLALVSVLGVEGIGRFYLGLCDPPLLLADPDMEYILKPTQNCRQFGHRIFVNEYSMRADSFPKTRKQDGEFRVMVLGDSVVYGGSQVDQADLATSRLQETLSRRRGGAVVVGNISAGSWGPQNLLAYARRFGWFDADVVVIVVSQQDYDDAMTFAPIVGIDPSFPARKPMLASWEIATRYLPRYLAIRASNAATIPMPDAPHDPQAVEASMNALGELVRSAKKIGARVIVAQHWQVPELSGGPLPEQELIASTARDAGAEIVQLGPAMQRAVNQGERPYRDYIHPTAAGQRVIAEVFLDAVAPLKDGQTSGPQTRRAK